MRYLNDKEAVLGKYVRCTLEKRQGRRAVREHIECNDRVIAATFARGRPEVALDVQTALDAQANQVACRVDPARAKSPRLQCIQKGTVIAGQLQHPGLRWQPLRQ